MSETSAAAKNPALEDAVLRAQEVTFSPFNLFVLLTDVLQDLAWLTLGRSTTRICTLILNLG